MSPEHSSRQIASTSPIERVNKNLVAALVVEQNEEWHLTRRYMSHESPARVINPDLEQKLLDAREVA